MYQIMNGTGRASASKESNGHSPKVFIVDSDGESAKFVTDLAHSRRLAAEHFSSAEEFWERLDERASGCAVIELDLPGMSGIQLQERMSAAGIQLPVIVTAAEADTAVAVRAMKLGAADLLQKPCHPLELWEAIQTAIERDRVQRREASIRSGIRGRLQTLTAQEQTVMQMVLAGKPNKSIAQALDLSIRSIDFRRASILRKMQASSLVDLIQMVMLDRHTVQGSMVPSEM